MIRRDREGQVLETLPDIALILVGALWLVGGCALGLGWLKFEGLERASADVVADELSPRLVSVIIPARDEAASIGRTLEQLSRATYPRLEVFVVDDSSRDATGSIARAVATSWDRIQVLEIDRLAPEWLGKPYALQHGFDHSRGEWLCFIDADVHLEPTCIEKAVRLAEARGLDHLSVFPTMVVDGMLETAFVMAFAFYFGAYVQPWKAKRANSSKFCGVGAFNLVRRDAYEAIGIHERLRLEIADDIKLGKLIKHAGLRQDAVDGDGLLRVQWQRGRDRRLRSRLGEERFCRSGLQHPKGTGGDDGGGGDEHSPVRRHPGGGWLRACRRGSFDRRHCRRACCHRPIHVRRYLPFPPASVRRCSDGLEHLEVDCPRAMAWLGQLAR